VTPYVERKCDSPFAVGGTEAQFLHIRVPGSAQSIRAWPPELRPDKLKERCHRQNLESNIFGQRSKFFFKLIADFNNPFHSFNMTQST